MSWCFFGLTAPSTSTADGSVEIEFTTLGTVGGGEIGQATVDETTMDITLENADCGISWTVMVDQVWQDGFSGTWTTGVGFDEYNWTISTHPTMVPGTWTLEVSATCSGSWLGDVSDEIVITGSTPTAATWDTVAATGRGQLVYYLEIVGVGVFTTYDQQPPNESWDDDYNTYSMIYPWLTYDIDPIKEEVDFIEARLKVGKIKCEIVDVAGGFTALLKGWRSWTHTWLTSTIDSDTTTIPVIGTTGLSTGPTYIGGEVFTSSTVSTDAFYGVTRGEFNSNAIQHYVNLDDHPASQPVVTAGPHTLIGRRAYLRAAVIDPDTGDVGTSTIIYRGIVGKGIRAGRGTWTIPIEHISDALIKSKVGEQLPETMVEPYTYYIAGGGGNSAFYIDYDADMEYIEIDEGVYTAPSLAQEINNEVGSITNYCVQIYYNGDKYEMLLRGTATDATSIAVAEGSVLWILGFSAQTYSSEVNVTGQTFTASDPPRLWYADIGDSSRNPQVVVRNGSYLTSTLWCQFPSGPLGIISDISLAGFGTHDVVTINGATIDRTEHVPSWSYVEDEEDLILRHAIAIGYPKGIAFQSLRGTLQWLLGINTNQQAEPRWWFQNILTNDDFDWTEFDDCIDTIPPHLDNQWLVINEGVEVWKVVGQVLGALAITPRLTTDGKIGFVRLSTPLATQAETIELDSEVWSLLDASEMEARLDDAPILNQVQIDHSKAYIEDDWGMPLKIYWREGLENLFMTRKITYECPGWQCNGTGLTIAALNSVVVDTLFPTHFGLWGRESATIDIPCTWTARQFKCGDHVLVTHPTLPNTVDGEIGVTSRIGLVVGRKFETTPRGDDTDDLLVRLAPEVNSGGIAPCALATAWNQGTTTVTFSTCDTPLYAQGTGNDLDVFNTNDTSTQSVLFIEYNVSSAPTTWSGTISTGGVSTADGTVVLTTDVFSTGFPSTGAWMTIPDWDSAHTWQQAYAYICDLTPTLGAAGDDPKEWTI